MKVSVSQVYTSVACNRIPKIADWNKDGLICFGASHAVVVYDTKLSDKDPLTVLSHHLNTVNSVSWLVKHDGTSTEFLSCSADKSAAVWSLTDGNWVVTSTLTGHGDGVTCIHGVYTNTNDLVVYTGCIDSNIRVWERNNGNTSLKQIISLHSGLCLSLHAHILPNVNKPVLFCALDDHKIHIFVGDEEYHRVHTLVGHDDWVRGLDVLDVDNDTILLASASQDTYIRLWRIQRSAAQARANVIAVEEKVFQAHGVAWAVTLDAVLGGHEGWVYGVQWYPKYFDGETGPVYRLLSASLDKTLIVWEPGSGGAWAEAVRVGEAGGSGLGFYGGRFGPGGRLLGHGYNGSFHMWQLDEESKQWRAVWACGGHFGAVVDARWEPRGRYLLSAAADQTTRVHAPWRRPDGGVRWGEVARPQVHGYDMAALAPVSAAVFAAAAEEKVVRVFRAPHNFMLNFANITGEALEDDDAAGPEGAAVPSLGLSNKAVFGGGAAGDDENEGYFVPVEMHEPPTEDTLQQHTLWPERGKLYGHGYEVFALDASPDGELLASACKATSPEHAAVLLWDTSSWQEIQKLVSHQLTVTQLSFSPDSRRLVSVSRDRRWALYARRAAGRLFDVAARSDTAGATGAHARIVWCCAWSPDGDVFATGSRDGKVCVWRQSEATSEGSLDACRLAGAPLAAGAAVTALAFAPVAARVLAAGLETGVIRIYGVGDTWTLLYEMDQSAAHHLTVKRLSFRPQRAGDEAAAAGAGGALLASCGADHAVRIHALTFTS